jgi:hypothetical protein
VYQDDEWSIWYEQLGTGGYRTWLADGINDEADARLIAAAPELLEALQGLLAAVQRSACDGSGPAQEAAHAAIAKATGGTE